MPRPPHICTCGRTVAHGARCTCQIESTRARNRRHDVRRPSARERGYTSDWDRERKAFLIAHPDCAACGVPATVVDHIEPHRGNKTLFWDRYNWQPLCTSCHSRHKQREERTGLKVMTIKNRLRAGRSMSDALAPFDKRAKLFSEKLS